MQFADTVRMTRYDANNDMQLTQAQAQATMGISMATRVAMLHGTTGTSRMRRSPSACERSARTSTTRSRRRPR